MSHATRLIPHALIAHFFIFIGTCFWSTAGLFTRIVETDAPTTLFWRSLFGGICVLAFQLWVNRSSPYPASLKASLLLSRAEWIVATITAAGMLAFVSAFFYTSIANVTFFYGTMPITTFVLSMILLGARFNAIVIGACILSLIGVLLILSGAQNFDDIMGLSLAALMVLSMAGLTIGTRYFLTIDPVKTTYLAGFIGAVCMLPFTTFGTTSTTDFLWLVLYGVTNVGLGFGFYILGVKYASAMSGAMISLMEIPMAPLWAWLLFAETIGHRTFMGGGTIVTATIIYLIYQHKLEPRKS